MTHKRKDLMTGDFLKGALEFTSHFHRNDACCVSTGPQTRKYLLKGKSC